MIAVSTSAWLVPAKVFVRAAKVFKVPNPYPTVFAWIAEVEIVSSDFSPTWKLRAVKVPVPVLVACKRAVPL